MGRLNKKLTLKAKKAGKTQLTLAKVAAVEEAEVKVQTSNPSPAPSPIVLLKPKVENVSTSNLVPKKLSRVTKKEKRKLKSEGLKNKLTQFAKDKQEAKDRAKRAKAVITGDLQPMKVTLTELLEAEDCQKVKPEKAKAGGHKDRRTMKRAKKEMLSDLSVFQQVLAHPEYAKDPFKTISTHIENKMLLEAMRTNQ